MKPNKRFRQVQTVLLTLATLGVMGCQSQLPVEDEQSSSTVDKRDMAPQVAQEAYKGSNAMANSNASFPVFHKGFNHNTDPWADQSNPGATGWCGTVELHDKNNGPVKPSKGKGYATVEQGPCNDFWTSVGIEENSPANTLNFDLFSTSWPESGFVQQLDIYLDPADFGEGLAFRYINSLNALNSTVISFDFLYFHVDVNKESGALDVAGHTIEDEGWYTFRYVFNSDAAGYLTVEFQLVDNGQPLHTESIDNTFLGLTSNDFEVSELGSGYNWFEQIAEGVALPIDEQHLHPANKTP